MKYICMSAVFDDIDTAEATARNLTHRVTGIKSIKLHTHRQQHLDADRYSSLDLTAATNTGYTNVAPGVIPPQGAAPMLSMLDFSRRRGSYTDRKVRMTLVIPRDKASAVSSNIVSGGGHYIKVQ